MHITTFQAGANLCVQDHDSLTPLDHVNFDRPLYVTFSQSLPTQIYVWGSNTNYNLGQVSRFLVLIFFMSFVLNNNHFVIHNLL